VDLGALHRDIESLISSARADFATNPFDVAIQQRLKALLDLQGILQRQQLPPDQLKLVRNQVSALAPAPKPAAFPPVIPAPLPLPLPPQAATPQPQPQPNLAALLNSNTLAGLLQATATRQQPTPPPALASSLASSLASTPQAAESPLIASLRARGLLPATGTPPTTAFNLPLIIPGQTPPAVPTPQLTSDITINVHLSTASIKM
jgi:pre-mRNA cleavage complex 2 protein Pcf11